MTDAWVDALLRGVFGLLALVGYWLSCIDFERKTDEGREIDRRARGNDG